jgi:uncharacterized protein YpmS
MDYFLGLLTAVVFFIAFLFFFYLGTRYGSKKTTVTADDEVQRKAKSQAEKHREDLMNLINYDVEKAMQRKKVT